MTDADPYGAGPRRGAIPGAVLLVSILKVAVVALDTLILAPIMVGVSTVDPGRAYRLCQLWSLAALVGSGVRVRARRTAPLDPRQPYVFMANHRSHFDVLAIIETLHEFQLRWVAKAELTRVPVFGRALERLDHIIIDRSNHAQSVASLRAAREKMARGISVAIFPEGTRAADVTTLLPFKKGGFMLAVETGFPIVPIAVRGSEAVLARDDWHIHAGEIEVVVGPPIPTAGADRDALVAQVRAWIAAHACPTPAHATACAAIPSAVTSPPSPPCADAARSEPS